MKKKKLKTATTDVLTVWWANQNGYDVIAWREIIFPTSRFDLPHKPRLFVSQEGLPAFNHGCGAGDWGFASTTYPYQIFVQTGSWGAQAGKERKVLNDPLLPVIKNKHDFIFVLCFDTTPKIKTVYHEYRFKQSELVNDGWKRSTGTVQVFQEQLDFAL